MWFSKDGGLTNDFSNAKVYDSPNIPLPERTFTYDKSDWKVVHSNDIVKGMGEGLTYKLKKDSEPKPRTKTVYVLKNIKKHHYYTDRLPYTRMIEYAKRFDTVKEAHDFIINYLQECTDWCFCEYEVEDLKDEVVTNNPWDVKNYKPPFEDVIKDIAQEYVYMNDRQQFIDEVMSYYRKYQPEEDVNDLITNMRQEIDNLKFRLQQSDTAFENLTEHCAKQVSDNNKLQESNKKLSTMCNEYIQKNKQSDVFRRKYFAMDKTINDFKKLLK